MKLQAPGFENKIVGSSELDARAFGNWRDRWCSPMASSTSCTGVT